jgi:hypothetical protein
MGLPRSQRCWQWRRSLRQEDRAGCVLLGQAESGLVFAADRSGRVRLVTEVALGRESHGSFLIIGLAKVRAKYILHH